VIDVSTHGADRRQRAEPRKYVRAANIPGMDDGIAAGKCRERLRPQQAMGIGNSANGSHHAAVAKSLSGVEKAISESHDLGVASRLNPCAFHHEHYSAFGRPRAMLYAVRNCESLIRRELDRFVFQVDEQLAQHHEEKLVLLVVVMPVKFTLNDTKSNDTVVDRTKRLIEPLFLNIGADPIDINDIQETVFDILVDCVGSHFRSPSESELLAIPASYVRPIDLAISI
jgi:hypothetical protein